MPISEQPLPAKQRTLRPVLAFLSSFLGLGLSLVYVGELKWAIAFLIGAYGLVAISGWSGFVTSSVTAFWLVSSVFISTFVISAILSTVIAFRDRHRATRAYNRWWFYLVWLLLAVLISLGSFKYRGVLFGYDLYCAPSMSMSPTIELGDCFVVNSWQFHHDLPVDGDIVVLNLNDGTRTKYTKRVVGVPGDRIELRDSVLIRNGQPVSDRYVHPVASFPAYGRDYGPLEVAPGQVFVLGDYRDNSIDSRKWGTIPINQIQGLVRFIWISYVHGSVRLDRIGKDLHTPR